MRHAHTAQKERDLERGGGERERPERNPFFLKKEVQATEPSRDGVYSAYTSVGYRRNHGVSGGGEGGKDAYYKEIGNCCTFRELIIFL